MPLARIEKGMGPARYALITQLIRYGLVGLAVTSLQAAVYWLLAERAQVHSQIANFAGYIMALCSGYVLHGRYTFSEAAKPATNAGHAVRGTKFVAASLISWALNALWVWLCISWRGWPTWSPIPAMLFVTPALVFILNRKWVFR